MVCRMLLCFAIIMLVIPLFYIQVVAGPAYAAAGIRGRSVSYTLDAPRGTIYDSTGQVLASSSTRYDIIADPSNIAKYRQIEQDPATGVWKIVGVGPAAAARQMAPILGMDEHELGGLLSQKPHSEEEAAAEEARVEKELKAGNKKVRNQYNSRYQVIATLVTPEVRRQIAELNITGITTPVRSERLYPRGATAANLLGFMADKKNREEGQVGIAGLELTQEKILQSTQGKGRVEVSGKTGAVIPGGQRTETPAIRGTDVHLSLNADLTAYAQEVADEAKNKFGSEWVVAVVEEVKTGRILAIGDSGVIARKDIKDGSDIQYASHAVKDVYEPGSTGKVLTMAAALEQGVVEPLTPIMCPDTFTTPNGQTFRDSHQHEPERLTAAGVLAKSSNTGIVQIGDKVKDEDRYQLMRAFGWGEATGIDLPSESG